MDRPHLFPRILSLAIVMTPDLSSVADLAEAAANGAQAIATTTTDLSSTVNSQLLGAAADSPVHSPIAPQILAGNPELLAPAQSGQLRVEAALSNTSGLLPSPVVRPDVLNDMLGDFLLGGTPKPTSSFQPLVEEHLDVPAPNLFESGASNASHSSDTGLISGQTVSVETKPSRFRRLLSFLNKK
jgi:hypothetical protein